MCVGVGVRACMHARVCAILRVCVHVCMCVSMHGVWLVCGWLDVVPGC